MDCTTAKFPVILLISATKVKFCINLTNNIIIVNIAASSDGGPKPSANANPVASVKLCPVGTCITVTL